MKCYICGEPSNSYPIGCDFLKYICEYCYNSYSGAIKTYIEKISDKVSEISQYLNNNGTDTMGIECVCDWCKCNIAPEDVRIFNALDEKKYLCPNCSITGMSGINTILRILKETLKYEPEN